MFKKTLSCCLFFLLFIAGKAQQCSLPGQTPVTALFVCSAETFNMTTPEFCGQANIPSPCNDGALYQNVNPNFFRFACYSSGALAFTIVPNDPATNYNWQLFDVTNTNPSDIFTNSSLFVGCNWSSEPGETGASIDGTNPIVCTGSGLPLFSKMPDLVAGRTYLLMVTNHSNSVAGYDISFSGGTAIITDPVDPHMGVTELSCDRTRITLRLNKQVKCNTVAADGSDFIVTGGVNVINAIPFDCSSQFGTPAVILTLDQPLAYGNYTVTINNGNDGNTLTDNCSRNIASGETVPLVSVPQQFTAMDSLFTVACSPQYLELVFRQPIVCSTIAANGSDFQVTGPMAVAVTPTVTCSAEGATNIIRLNVSGNLAPGNYQLRLTTGTDGNTILNQCAVSTPAGSLLSFTVAQGVDAAFTSDNNASCSQHTVAFSHNGANNVNSWSWNFGNGTNSGLNNPVINFAKGDYNVRLIVSNGICADTSSQVVRISDGFKAAFDMPSFACAGEEIKFTDKSNGSIDGWQWSFGNGVNSSQQSPTGIRYPDLGRDAYFTVRLQVSNSVLGCSDVTTRVVKVLRSCLIAVPNAFTPNGDGKNDYLYPLNAVKAENLEFKVYNRSGQLVFHTRDWTRKWDGKLNGLLQETGVYAWFLTYTHRDSGERMNLKGTTLLLR